MKFTCTKENFFGGLQAVTGIANKPSNLPILSNIHVKASESGVTLMSTNLEVGITAHVRAKVETPGAFTVPAKTLYDFTNLLEEEQVSVSLEGSELQIESGGSKTKIKGMPSEDYPVLPEIDESHAFVLDVEIFKQALSQVVFSAARNEIRPELSGVVCRFFADGEEGLTMAATDSYRLAEKNIAVVQGNDAMEIIVPGRTVSEIIRLLGIKTAQSESQVRIWVGETQLGMRIHQYEMTSRLVDGTYPDYKQIIPTVFETTAQVDRDVFVKKIKAASLFVTSGINAVALTLNPSANQIEVSSTSSQTGQHDATLDADVTGHEHTILLNFRYLLDGLSHMSGDRLNIQMDGPDRPAMLQSPSDPNYKYIVMPIRQ